VFEKWFGKLLSYQPYLNHTYQLFLLEGKFKIAATRENKHRLIEV